MTTDSPTAAEKQAVNSQDANAGSSSTPESAGKPQDANQAASSPAADGAKKPGSSLEAVQQALANDAKAAQAVTEKADAAAGATPGTDGGSQGAGKDGKPEGTQPPADDANRLDKHPRFREVLGKLKAAEPKAQQFEQLQAWIGESGITAQKLVPFLTAARLSVRDPEKALSVMRDVVSQLERAVGEIIPEDLQEKVARGVMDEETAREVVIRAK